MLVMQSRKRNTQSIMLFRGAYVKAAGASSPPFYPHPLCQQFGAVAVNSQP